MRGTPPTARPLPADIAAAATVRADKEGEEGEAKGEGRLVPVFAFCPFPTTTLVEEFPASGLFTRLPTIALTAIPEFVCDRTGKEAEPELLATPTAAEDGGEGEDGEGGNFAPAEEVNGQFETSDLTPLALALDTSGRGD